MMRDLKWSPAEKVLARRAFDRALKLESKELIRDAKERAGRVEEASELWNLEHWLTQRRLDIERKYDYRYSVLPIVFATLLKEGRIREQDLLGLDPAKVELIRRLAS
jgi:Photoprotection regulator fluorescence recovery protein